MGVYSSLGPWLAYENLRRLYPLLCTVSGNGDFTLQHDVKMLFLMYFPYNHCAGLSR